MKIRSHSDADRRSRIVFITRGIARQEVLALWQAGRRQLETVAAVRCDAASVAESWFVPSRPLSAMLCAPHFRCGLNSEVGGPYCEVRFTLKNGSDQRRPVRSEKCQRTKPLAR